MRMKFFLLLLVLASQPIIATAGPAQELQTATPHTEDKAWETLQAARIAEGDRLLIEKRPQDAIREAFDPLLRDYEARYSNPENTYYSARTSAETLTYLVGAAAKHDRGEQVGNTLVVSHLWAYGYYGMAYALLELGRLDEAQQALEKALQLSPQNPQFLSERGYLHQLRKEWQPMLESNLSAAAAVAFASPEDNRDKEHARALRGQGFALIELNRLDDAEVAFRESLKLDPENQMARDELIYITQLRNPSRQNRK